MPPPRPQFAPPAPLGVCREYLHPPSWSDGSVYPGSASCRIALTIENVVLRAPRSKFDCLSSAHRGKARYPQLPLTRTQVPVVAEGPGADVSLCRVPINLEHRSRPPNLTAQEIGGESGPCWIFTQPTSMVCNW